jgi:FkbM family methyltransferase
LRCTTTPESPQRAEHQQQAFPERLPGIRGGGAAARRRFPDGIEPISGWENTVAIAAWKRLEKSPGYQRKKLFLKRLIGKEPLLKPEIRLSTASDGGWRYHPDDLNEASVVYSLGIGKDIEFDVALIRAFGLQVHAFDPTPSTREWLRAGHQPAGFHFHPWAVTAKDGTIKLYPRIHKDGSKSADMYTLMAADTSRPDAIEVPAFSLGSIAASLGHARIDLLKMDIEGAEYQVLDTLQDSAVKPRQLLVEFHHRFAGIGPARTVGAVAALGRLGYRLFAISDTGRELSFLRDRTPTRGDGS